MKCRYLRQMFRGLTAAALCAGLLAPLAQAAELPGSYPSTFQEVGTIDALDLAQNNMVINDGSVTLTDDTAVYSIHGRTGKYALRKGERVGIKYVDTTQGKNVVRSVTAIWILPEQ